MHLRSIATAILVSLSLPLTAGAQEARVRIVFRTDTSQTFEHRSVVRGPPAQRLGSPTPADLKPYVLAAKKALAERQGYGERVFGADNHRLARGRVIEASVQDAGGRTLWTSREPLEAEASRTPTLAKRTFEPQDDDDAGFGPGGGRGKRARASGGTSRQWPFLR